MPIIQYSDYIKCCFKLNPNGESEYDSASIDVFYAEIKYFESLFSYFMDFITEDEKLLASKLYSDTARKTYVACHALLRLILAKKLNMDPLELSIVKGSNNKPGLLYNQAYFNVSHTREAFAFAIAKDFHVGIDIEKIKKSINLQPILNNFFSFSEREYVLNSEAESLTRFFLLWTRKEALLKALGTGIIYNLNQIIVSDPVNYLRKELFDNLVDASLLNQYYMYSYYIRDHFICIAFPFKCSISFYNLNEEFFPWQFGYPKPISINA